MLGVKDAPEIGVCASPTRVFCVFVSVVMGRGRGGGGAHHSGGAVLHGPHAVHGRWVGGRSQEGLGIICMFPRDIGAGPGTKEWDIVGHAIGVMPTRWLAGFGPYSLRECVDGLSSARFIW